jgi:hypothetical protein
MFSGHSAIPTPLSSKGYDVSMAAEIVDDPIGPPFKWQRAFAEVVAGLLPSGRLVVTRFRVPRRTVGLIFYRTGEDGRTAYYKMRMTREGAETGLEVAEHIAARMAKHTERLLIVA